MDIRLNDKVTVVTGGSTGIGAATLLFQQDTEVIMDDQSLKRQSNAPLRCFSLKSL